MSLYAGSNYSNDVGNLQVRQPHQLCAVGARGKDLARTTWRLRPGLDHTNVCPTELLNRRCVPKVCHASVCARAPSQQPCNYWHELKQFVCGELLAAFLTAASKMRLSILLMGLAVVCLGTAGQCNTSAIRTMSDRPPVRPSLLKTCYYRPLVCEDSQCDFRQICGMCRDDHCRFGTAGRSGPDFYRAFLRPCFAEYVFSAAANPGVGPCRAMGRGRHFSRRVCLHERAQPDRAASPDVCGQRRQ